MNLLFKALSDETRLKIMNMLKQKELCGCTILDELNITQPTLSHHMKLLLDLDLITCRKEGKWCHYNINKNKMYEIETYIKSFIL